MGENELLLTTEVLVNEAELKTDGTVPIRIIAPGWGSSGYYSKEVLERDGHIFEGAHMYWDHPTQSDRKERPERSLRDLAAVISGPVRYQENGVAGPGLYAEAKVLKQYRDTVAELAPYIGVSIRAEGTAVPGEKEGRKGAIVEAMAKAHSVDFVTKPGAGGRILAMFESARGLNEDSPDEGVEMATLEEAVAARVTAERERDEARSALSEAEGKVASAERELTEAKEENGRLRDRILITEAQTHARKLISEARLPGDRKLPDVTVTRLVEQLSANPPAKDDGTLNIEKFNDILKEGIKAEVKYLGEAVGGGGGITGHGGSDDGIEFSEKEQKDLDEALSASLGAFGLSETGLKAAVGGRS